MKHLLRLLPFALLLTSTLVGQTWTQLAPTTNPTTRRSGAIAYSPTNAGLLMHGGLQSGPTLTLNETWLWNGVDWVQLAPATTPGPRWGHRMVYDSHRGRIVTFGGRSTTNGAGSGTSNETWEWDGSAWQQMFTATSPSARAFYSMAFDERRGKVILYGTMSGSTVGASGGNQTWEYDGTTWTQVIAATTPPGLETPAMVYDKGRAVVVMFGGWNGLAPGTLYNTTYEYDGVDWTLRATPNAPPGRYRAGCHYDDARGRVVVYGGLNAGALTDTWEYDGSDWTQVATSGPAKSTECYVGYDPVLDTPILFGGSGPTGTSNETWLFTAPTNAIAAPFGSGCATSAGVPTLAPTTTPVLGTNYTLNLSNGSLTTVSLVVHGLDNLQFPPGSYLPLDLTFLGIGGCKLEVTPDALFTEIVVSGTMNHALAIPNTLTLTGTALFSQVLVIDGAAPNAFGGMSNAVHAVLGS